MDVLHKYYIVKLYNIMNDKKLAIRIEWTAAPHCNTAPKKVSGRVTDSLTTVQCVTKT